MADNLKLIRNEVGKGLAAAGLLRVAILTIVTQGGRDPENLSAGRTLTETTKICKGLVVQWSKEYGFSSDVVVSDRIVLLTGKHLGSVVPKVGDKITIEGVTSRIIEVGRDAASATYLCATRS